MMSWPLSRKERNARTRIDQVTHLLHKLSTDRGLLTRDETATAIRDCAAAAQEYLEDPDAVPRGTFGSSSCWAVLLAQSVAARRPGGWMVDDEDAQVAWSTRSLHAFLGEHRGERFTAGDPGSATLVGRGSCTAAPWVRNAGGHETQRQRSSRTTDALGSDAALRAKACTLHRLLQEAGRPGLPEAIIELEPPSIRVFGPLHAVRRAREAAVAERWATNVIAVTKQRGHRSLGDGGEQDEGGERCVEPIDSATEVDDSATEASDSGREDEETREEEMREEEEGEGAWEEVAVADAAVEESGESGEAGEADEAEALELALYAAMEAAPPPSTQPPQPPPRSQATKPVRRMVTAAPRRQVPLAEGWSWVELALVCCASLCCACLCPASTRAEWGLPSGVCPVGSGPFVCPLGFAQGGGSSRGGGSAPGDWPGWLGLPRRRLHRIESTGGRERSLRTRVCARVRKPC